MSINKSYMLLTIPLFLTLLSGLALSSTSVSADDTVIDEVNITVPISCTLTGVGMNSHNATISPGTYNSEVGTTTLKASCNDKDGFSIYAIGFTNDTYGDNTLVSTTLATPVTIATGTSTSGNSQWAMKLTTDGTATYPIQLQNSFGSFHTVPDSYTLVAKRTAATDVGAAATGSVLTTTYQVFIATNQAADTYTGKVKYTMVHPASARVPVPVSENLYYAITGTANNYTLTISNSDITAGAIASGSVAIDGYTPQETIPWDSYGGQITSVVVSGTVAPTSTSRWFSSLGKCSSWNLTGLKTDNVTDMSSMFASAGSNTTTFSLDLSSWDTSNATNMAGMFMNAGFNTTTFSLDLSSWDTSNVTNMSYMFAYTGYNDAAWSIIGLSSLDTSNVTDMSSMFEEAGFNATTFSLDLSSWDTSNVTNMLQMFEYAGGNATTFSLDLSSWDTSNVTNMSSMFMAAGSGSNATTFSLDLSSWDTSNVTSMSSVFSYAGYNATNWAITIPPTNNGTTTGSIANTTSRLYGKTNSIYIAPPEGNYTRSFTLGT